MRSLVLLAAMTALSGFSADDALRDFVTAPVLPYGGIAASSSGVACREVDELDVACDEKWCALKSKAEYDAYRKGLRARMLAAIGTFPERTPLNARTVATLKRDGYVIEKVIFESMPGLLVTANLFVPDGAGRRPAVVMSCGHSAVGKDCDVYQRACVIAVRQGFVALMFDPYFQGERVWTNQRGSTTEHTQMGLRANLLDGSASLLRIWDGMRAIDYVLSRPEVDSARLGYMGNSGGGTMTALMEAADDRIRAAAPSCYLTSLRAVCNEIGPQDGEQNIYGQLSFGLNHTGYVLIPDIPVAVTCKFSDFFPFGGVRTLFKTVRTLERNVGLGERAFLNAAPGPHGWTEALETASVRFLARQFLPDCRELKIDSEDLWTCDLGSDITKMEIGLSTDEVGCTPAYSTQKAGSRHIGDILAERFAASAARRKALGSAEKRTLAAKLAKVRRPAETGYRVKETFADETNGFSVVRLVVQYPKTGHALPAVLLAKRGAEGEPVLVTATSREQGLRLATAFLEKGHPVMIADVSGIGEIGQAKHVFYGCKERPDEGLGAMCYLIGEPLVGRRATDMLVLGEVLSRRFGGRKPRLVAADYLAIPAAHARAADGAAFSSVTLSGKATGWADVLAAGSKDETIIYYADIVPRAALSYDWPELLK